MGFIKRILPMFLVFLFLCSACSKNNSSLAQEASNTSQPSDQTGRNRGNFTPPDISGEVSSIKDGEVALKLIEVQNNRTGQTGRPTRDPNATQGVRPTRDPNRTPGQGMMNNQQPVKFTGETTTVKINEGIQITTFERSGNGMQNKNIKISDIKNRDILQIWYKDKESKTIERITVRTAISGQ